MIYPFVFVENNSYENYTKNYLSNKDFQDMVVYILSDYPNGPPVTIKFEDGIMNYIK